MSNLITLNGTFIKEFFRNHKGTATFVVKIADFVRMKRFFPQLKQNFTCKGIIPEYIEGTPLELVGTIEEDKYGKYLNISRCEERCFSAESTAVFLQKLVPGISFGEAISVASAISDIFSFVTTKNAAESMSARTILPLSTCKFICERITNMVMLNKVIDFLSPYSVETDIIYSIVREYGIDSLKILNENPYDVGCKCGLSIKICDNIANDNGLKLEKPRAKRIIYGIMEEISNRGHVFCRFNDILRRLYKENLEIEDYLVYNILSEDSDFVVEKENDANEEIFYLKNLYKDECGVANQLNRLLSTSIPLCYKDNIVSLMSEKIGIKYAPQQAAAFKLLKNSGVKVITGGPGTGKTTCVNGVVSAYEYLNPDKIIKLCAPTGRAAQRMTESTGREAVTIHRLLDFKQSALSGITHKNADNPIDADLIVVDESSMLDVTLANIFLSAVKDGATVLFVGDINQLPSVGPGDVLNNMIRSNRIDVVGLTNVYRQASHSPIVTNAIRINNGDAEIIDAPGYRTIKCNDNLSLLREVTVKSLMLYDKETPFGTQVLCTARKCENGVYFINSVLQNLLNPPAYEKTEYVFGKKTYRLGDKVIMTRNNYLAGYYNGDLGIISEISHGNITIKTSERELVIENKNLKDMQLAYAMTIHKSQGSEFKHVILVLPSEPHGMLKRNLLYTGITRAKESVYVLDEGDSVNTAIATLETGTRNTKLTERISLL